MTTKQQSLADELAEWVANETGAEEDADMFDSLVARVRELEECLDMAARQT